MGLAFPPEDEEGRMDAANLGLLMLRLAVGGTMAAHGYNHIWGGGKIKGTAGWFESLGMKPGKLHAWLASITELGAGALLALGLLTPLAGAGCAAVMLVAWLTNHRTNGFFIFRPGEGYEYVMNLFVASLALAFIGAGEWSLDHAFDIAADLDGWTAVIIGLVGGIGGALGLLAVFWRPVKKDPAAS
jgi:putative oxidoreductase